MHLIIKTKRQGQNSQVNLAISLPCMTNAVSASGKEDFAYDGLRSGRSSRVKIECIMLASCPSMSITFTMVQGPRMQGSVTAVYGLEGSSQTSQSNESEICCLIKLHHRKCFCPSNDSP